MTTVKPLYDRVLVKRCEAPNKKGSIFLPETAKEKPLEGTVIAVGSGKLSESGVEPLTVKAGDRVLFGAYSGTEVTVNDETLLIISESDLFGTLS